MAITPTGGEPPRLVAWDVVEPQTTLNLKKQLEPDLVISDRLRFPDVPKGVVELTICESLEL